MLSNEDVPWHRVINAQGEISRRCEPGCEDVQRVLLEKEGVEFDERGRVSLKRFGWKNESSKETAYLLRSPKNAKRLVDVVKKV